MGRTIDHLNRRSKLRNGDLTEAQAARDGEWSREKLERMDAKFCAAMARSEGRPAPQTALERKKHRHDTRRETRAP